MKTVSDILRYEPVWVNPSHRVESAIWLMRGHDVSGLPVLRGEELVGMVLYKHLLGVDPRRTVGEVMDAEVVAVPPTLSIRQAADLMTRANKGPLPVLDSEQRLLGILTHSDLLAELRRSADPITELPWSDSLHDWAIDALRGGQEITILFVDVDQFGQFNKRYGHIVGDAVLKSVARILQESTDAQVETVCRYGGDEFCIATLRSVEQAAALGERIQRTIAGIHLAEADNSVLSVSIGQRGGRRTREREHVHYTATLNSLINLASQDCIRKKPNASKPQQARNVAEASPPPAHGAANGAVAVPGALDIGSARGAAMERAVVQSGLHPGLHSGRVRLARLEVAEAGDTATVSVELERAEEATSLATPRGKRPEAPAVEIVTTTATLSRPAQGDQVLALVAETLASALRRALPESCDIQIAEVLRASTGDDRALVTVVGTFTRDGETAPITGTALAGSDLYRAAAAATLAAANRQLDYVWQARRS